MSAIDDAIRVHEFLQLMDTKLTDEIPVLCSVPEVSFVGFTACREDFLNEFRQLTTGNTV